ncbi:unnamed protein product [Umbelopsis ramanniana]
MSTTYSLLRIVSATRGLLLNALLFISSVLAKTVNYVQAFSRFTNRDSVREVRGLLAKDSSLSQFEIAQLANLCCDDSEEAKALIPSLHNKIDDDRLQELMNQMLTIKKFQG